MANGDVIDTMFNWMIEIVGWIFKMMFKIAWGIIKFFWNLVKDIIAARKADNQQSSSVADNNLSSSNDGNSTMGYNVIVENINQADAEALNKRAETGNYSEDDTLYFATFMTIIFSGDISIREKFLLVEKANNSIEANLSQEVIAKFYPKVITLAYDGLAEYMTNSQMLIDHKNDFETNFYNGTLDNFTDDFQNLFAYSLLLGSNNANITISSEDFEDLNLPTPKYQ